ncbi:DENN domain-containing protein 1a [Plakobranchus ocellatus]|uniref:DENN domain-containing protein 1a n=1 Tax=Plakobranchus ocellatus TaxID=259542 RepID=A0AAV3ZXT3_9GAST|nr:DENN domain-containing protein 1a [Plakobranchus ocellatus]
MGSRIREKAERLFEVFLEVAKPDGEGEVPFVVQQFPEEYDDKEALAMIPKFTFPCESDSSKVDHFSFVLTDVDSMFRFGYCRHSTGHQTCLCIVSWLPWCEIFYKMLDLLAELTNRSEQDQVKDFLQAAYSHEVPASKVPVTIVSNDEMFNFTAPDPNSLPSIPGSRYLNEYYNAVDTFNMMHIFASMLHERRIYMTSKKLSRLTSCVFAAEALLYPMHWQHIFIPVLPSYLIEYLSSPIPYLIGVHGNLIPKLTEYRVDVADAVVVDLDNNTVTTEYEDLANLPEDVANSLKKDLKAETLRVSMLKTGDAISMAFLKALVRLIGGYRDALKFRPGEPITFDPKAFVQSRPSQSTQAFLEGMLSLQIFMQFIHGRLEILNAGIGFKDIFEQQATLYADKLNSQSGYEKWLEIAKKKSKNGFMGVKVKAAPMMSTAVNSLKEQSKRAMTKISGLTDNEDKKGGHFKPTGGVVHSKHGKGRPYSTIDGSAPKSERPPRPPPPSNGYKSKTDSLIRPQSINMRSSCVEKEESHDDSQLRLSYHRMDMSLMEDTDIQAAMLRSASAEILPSEVSRHYWSLLWVKGVYSVRSVVSRHC